MGRAWACSTLSATLLGPGPVIVFRGTEMGAASEAGAGTERGIALLLRLLRPGT